MSRTGAILDKTVIDLARRRLITYNPEKIILFGSYARGDADEHSDIDFVVIKRTDKRFIERLIEAALVVDIPSIKVEVFVYTPEEWQNMVEYGSPFAEQVTREGQVVYEKR